MSVPAFLAIWVAIAAIGGLTLGYVIGRADRQRHAIERALGQAETVSHAAERL